MGSGEDIRLRQARAVVEAAEEHDRALCGPDEARAVAELDALLPDLRRAVEIARDDPALIGRLAGAVHRYGYHRQLPEVLAWGLYAAGSGCAAALAAAATCAWYRGDLAGARELLASAPADPAVHEVLGALALVAGDTGTALANFRAMAVLATDDAVRASGLAAQALVLARSAHPDEAVTTGGSAWEIAEGTGNPSARAAARHALGEALGDRDPLRALALLDEAADLARSVSNRLVLDAVTSAAAAIRSGAAREQRRIGPSDAST
ncbi:hypothetical protein [Actinoplanes friuliensis]|uniref:Putative AfsR-family transcriptional regulator n=1 Tax=Actinoplanes friuliensis DSM 7358 TaxID=1246995 RepID=U5W764_9ACTN|nr:hypothetical protein [Actinoplanes friuliensis]AGZ44842.1 putative AfsR-family transcriptional regulator [Actinoplanes friuliensis DSM 7358]